MNYLAELFELDSPVAWLGMLAGLLLTGLGTLLFGGNLPHRGRRKRYLTDDDYTDEDYINGWHFYDEY